MAIVRWEYLMLEIFWGKCSLINCSQANKSVMREIENLPAIEGIEKLGLSGWEMIHVQPSTSNFEEDRHYFFKRKKQ